MRDPKRISEFLQELGVLWEQMPDMRFPQIYHYILDHVDNKGCSEDGFYIEDDVWLKKIKELQEDRKISNKECQRCGQMFPGHVIKELSNECGTYSYCPDCYKIEAYEQWCGDTRRVFGR